MYIALTYDVMKSISHLCETRKFVMAFLHWKQRLLCGKQSSEMVHCKKVWRYSHSTTPLPVIFGGFLTLSRTSARV